MGIEILAKLNPVSAKLEPQMWGSVDPFEIAAVLGMGDLERSAYLLAIAKYAGYQDVIPELKTLVAHELSERANFEGWHLLLRPLVSTAVNDFIEPHVCPSCRGTGKNRDSKNSGYPGCGGCGGTGKKPWTVRKIAGKCGMNRSTFHRSYLRRYRSIISYLRSLVADVHDHLERNFCENENKKIENIDTETG